MFGSSLRCFPHFQFRKLLQRLTVIYLCIFLSFFVTLIMSSSIFDPDICDLNVNVSKPLIILSESRTVVTIVIAYFPMSKSKHSSAQYLSWLENLLSFCESPMVIFTSDEYRSTLLELRHRRGPLPTHFVVDYDSPLDMPPIKKFKNTFQEQLLTDPNTIITQSNYTLFGVPNHSCSTIVHMPTIFAPIFFFISTLDHFVLKNIVLENGRINYPAN